MHYPTLAALTLGLFLQACQQSPAPPPTPPPNYVTYQDYPEYTGTDLGLQYDPAQSHFRVWAPSATSLTLRIYEKDLGGTPSNTVAMNRSEEGTWVATLVGDQKGKYYTFQAWVGNDTLREVPDPYAIAVGTNGARAQVIDLSEVSPAGWEKDQRPALADFSDIILYELHVRDLSAHPQSGIQHRGKFLGLTETGTATPNGQSTGLDHIRSLGVTHVHLLPAFDFRSVDESIPNNPAYNWGYDPQNYNVPEGSYATDPANGEVRIREFKSMVMALHGAGLRVVMDVVYNHTGDTENSLFNQLVPGYYYRQDDAGNFSNASGCGNETASERAMMRKYMIESVVHWAKEYHIDGFRFDLMAIHDIATMNAIRKALDAVDPSIFIYGEGWMAGGSPLPAIEQATKAQTLQLDGIAAFSDDLRDGLKGSVFDHHDRGFISGKENLEASIQFGVVGATNHPDIDYPAVNYSNSAWAVEPQQCINYVSCHDNHTLWDKLAISLPEASEEERLKRHRLALALVLTSQGVPFLHAGVEMARSKNGVENSYQSPDSINQIDWSKKSKYADLVVFVQDLIELRKSQPALRLGSTQRISELLRFLNGPQQTVGYQVQATAQSDALVLWFNGNTEAKTLELPKGKWNYIFQNNGLVIDRKAQGPASGTISVPALEFVVLKKAVN